MKQINVDLAARIRELREQVASGAIQFEPRTYSCKFCEGIGFVIRVDEKGRRWGRKCDCLVREIAASKAEGRARDRIVARDRPDDDIPF